MSYFLFDNAFVVLVEVLPSDCFALHSAHRFRCASAMRLRADADILGRRRRVTGSWTARLTPSVERFVPERPVRSSGNVA
jgi:hypothetical protein